MNFKSSTRKLISQSNTFFLFIRKLGLKGLNEGATYCTENCFKDQDDNLRLKSAIQWLCRAQDAANSSGVSSIFSMKSGWGVPYPETTGYIISTLLNWEDYTDDNALFDRIDRMANWLIWVQHSSGGIPSRAASTDLRIFNSGQVILGWIDWFEECKEPKVVDSARAAGMFLIKNQEADGSWINYTHCGPRTYHARDAWALLRLYQVTGDNIFIKSAKKSLNWVLSQQLDNGWFRSCGFFENNPITHVISYTLEGLLESYLILDENDPLREVIFTAVLKTANSIVDAGNLSPMQKKRGLIPASFDRDWKSQETNSCLTGNVQLAGLFYRLFLLTGNEKFRQEGDLLYGTTVKFQVINTALDCINGALPGSFPFFEGYHAYEFPNWGTKFLADVLLIRLRHFV